MNRLNNDTSKETEKEVRKYLTRISKKKARQINNIADAVHESVFGKIDCLDCANCCKQIPPIINDMDIRRASKCLGIKTNDFKEKYIRIDEDGDMVINATPCPFLEDDNKCCIYESRPRACREYPHTNNNEFFKNTGIHKINYIYCPAVLPIIKGIAESID